MEERRRAISLEKGIRAAMKMKDSKVGEVILKDNVKIKEQLSSEISQIDCQMQRKSEKLSHAKRQTLTQHQVYTRHSNSNIHLPPIFRDQMTSSTNTDSQDSLTGKKRWKQTTTKILGQVKRDRTLPKLAVPRMSSRPLDMNDFDCTKDPRFAKLVSQLVPSKSKLNELSESSEESLKDSNSEASDAAETKDED